MQIEQFKILRAARAIGDAGFTKPELVARADIGRAALDSFFRRNGDQFFEKVAEKRAGGAGRKSAQVWRLRRGVYDTVDELLDAQRATHPRAHVDPRAARDALKDDHARWQARISLFDAVDAGEGLARQQHLARCGKWIAHEERRHRHWGKAAVVPENVKSELRELRRRRDAVAWNVDQLARYRPMPTVKSAFNWLFRSAQLYDAGDQDAFAPLRLSNQMAPHKVLAEAILLCAEFDGCARERFIIAMIAMLPSLGHSDSRLLLCKTLDALGNEVGHALEQGVHYARHSDRQEALSFVPAVLIGLQSFPELLKRSRFESVCRWYDGLPWSPDWNDTWAPLWAELGPYTHKKPEFIRRRLRASEAEDHAADRLVVESLRGFIGSAYDRIYATIERQVDTYYNPPPSFANGDYNWLSASG